MQMKVVIDWPHQLTKEAARRAERHTTTFAAVRKGMLRSMVDHMFEKSVGSTQLVVQIPLSVSRSFRA